MQDPATAGRWLVLMRDAQGADQVKLVEYGHQSDVDLRPERFEQPEARLKAFGYPVSVNREGEER